MATAMETGVPEDMVNEAYRVMFMVAEMGQHPKAVKAASVEQFEYECEGELEDVVDALGSEDEAEMIKAAQTLVKIGDAKNLKEKKIEEEEKLVNEITEYLRELEKTINESSTTDVLASYGPSQMQQLFQTAAVSSVYNAFSSKLTSFLGLGQGEEKIPVVAHITKSVVSSFQQSSSHAVFLATSLSTKYIIDKFASSIVTSGGLAKMATQPK